MALGIPLGLPIGLAMANLAIGPAIGVAIGAGLGAALESAYLRRETMEAPETWKKKKIIRGVIIGLLAVGVIALTIIHFIIKGKP